MECSFNETEELLYRCFVENVKWTLPYESMIKNLTGTHLINKNDGDVTHFIVLESIVTQFPHNLEHFFPQLESIAIENAQMQFIFHESLMNLKELTWLNLRNNLLTVIGYQLFTSNVNLRIIDLNQNNITKIFPEAFNVTKLQSLKLSKNNCFPIMKDVDFDKNAIAPYIAEVSETCSCSSYVDNTCYDGSYKELIVSIIIISILMVITAIALIRLYIHLN